MRNLSLLCAALQRNGIVSRRVRGSVADLAFHPIVDGNFKGPFPISLKACKDSNVSF